MNVNKSIQLLQTEENELSLLEQNETVKQYLVKFNEHQKSIEEFKKQLKQYMLDKGYDELADHDASIRATITRAHTVEVENLDDVTDEFITLIPLDTENLVFKGDEVFTKTANLDLAKAYAKNGSVPAGFVQRELTPRFSLRINGKTI